MIRWLIVVFLALMIFSSLHRWLEKMGLGRLPGDFRFRLFGREFFVPLASSVLIAFVAMLIGQLVLKACSRAGAGRVRRARGICVPWPGRGATSVTPLISAATPKSTGERT